MSAAVCPAPAPAVAAPPVSAPLRPEPPVPGFFGPPAAPLFGWLYRPALATAQVRPASPGRTAGDGSAGAALGVLLCAPLGQEASNSYRTQQALAEALAARALPVLRFDYAGCGDSADRPDDPAQGALPAWQASVADAIDHLRAATGVPRVAVLALRAGALFAAPVALQRPDVAALVAVAPAIAGRGLLREWRALAATAARRDEQADGTLEVAGIAFSNATAQALGGLALAELAWPADRAVLLIDRDDLPGAARWHARLQADGVQVDLQAHGGIAAMLDEPQHQVVPQAMVASVADWLAARAAALAPPVPAMPSVLPADATDKASGAAPGSALKSATVAPGVVEQVLALPAGGSTLFALAALPARPHPGAATVLLPNTGPVHHIGGHRLYVQLARHLAAQGHRVLRLDLSGLGDSPARPGEPADEVYGRRAVDDLAAAVAAARSRWPDSPPVVLGLCAGGYHALRLAVRQAGVERCIIVNPLVYHWHEGMTLAGYEAELQARYYGSKWRRWDSWRRLLTGQSDVRLLARVAIDKARRVAAGLFGRSTGGAHHGPAAAAMAREAANDLNRDLLAAAAHGTRLDFVFSEGEPGWPTLQADGGRALERLQRSGALAVHHLLQADHTLTTRSARQRFTALVTDLLGPEPASGSKDTA